MPTTPVVQFGTSRFLQAHVDLFLSESTASGQAIGAVTVVQTTGDAGRAARLAGLAAGYDVRLRGLRDGRRVDEGLRVTSVARGLSLAQHRDEVERILREEAQIVLSNTADSGFRPQPADALPAYDPQMSYPAKLAHLLRPRFEAGQPPLQVMPTELVQDNGAVLRGLVLDAAAGMDRGYRDWLADGVVWVNSLVDRIVSEPLSPAGAVAEPYALWAIERTRGLVVPCVHPVVQVVSDLGPIERRKLFVLNLGHTWMVARWLARGRRTGALVREVMADAEFSGQLDALYAEEVKPGFAAAGEADGLDDYIAATRDRFANPFLDHRLEDIAQNHGEKLRRRIGAFLDWASVNGDTSRKPILEAALKGEGG